MCTDEMYFIFPQPCLDCSCLKCTKVNTTADSIRSRNAILNYPWNDSVNLLCEELWFQTATYWTYPSSTTPESTRASVADFIFTKKKVERHLSLKFTIPIVQIRRGGGGILPARQLWSIHVANALTRSHGKAHHNFISSSWSTTTGDKRVLIFPASLKALRVLPGRP